MAESDHGILMVRLGAMGDIIHALPAAASLKKSFPSSRICWVIAPKWKSLLAGRDAVDELILFRRSSASDLVRSWRTLRETQPEIAIDFQGLLQSALVARASRPAMLLGWDFGFARERLAGLLYSRRVAPGARHVVDQNLELAEAAGAKEIVREFPLPAGRPEGALPRGAYVLTNPFAGWRSKQWPIERYGELGKKLSHDGVALVANVPPQRARELAGLGGVSVHSSSLEGLIDATRRASAVLGLDSGPLHLAAALKKPGVALFGPTDPARNGPYGGTILVLRASGAETTYRRGDGIASSMLALSVEQVYECLMEALKIARSTA